VPAQTPLEPSDETLLTAVAGGDGKAFARLYERHGGALLRYLRRIVGDRAEDALQNAFIDAFRAASSFRGDSSARTWLFTIARHQALRMRRRTFPGEMGAIEEHDETPLLELGVAAGWGADPETLAHRARQRETLEAALAALQPADREVIVLRDVEQLTGPEAAQVIGLDLAALKSRLHRARLKLAGELRSRGVGDNDA